MRVERRDTSGLSGVSFGCQVSGLVRSGDGTGGFAGLGKAYFCHRYTILFYTLLLTMVAVPLVVALKLTGPLIDYLLAASLLAAIVPVDTAKNRCALLAITVVMWLARPVTASFDHPVLSAVTLGLWTVIGLLQRPAPYASPCVPSRSMQSIFMRRSAPMCSREFFSVYSTGFWKKSGPAPSPEPAIFPA